MSFSVSVIVIAYNEEKYIENIVDKIINQDFSREQVEIILVDSKSTDKTKKIMLKIKEKHKDRNIKVVDNPKKIQGAGWNAGIKEAANDIIFRLDAHGDIPINYISKCVKYIEKGENIVGGVVDTKKPKKSFKMELIWFYEKSKYGGGAAKFRRAGNTLYVDTLAFNCYRKEVFQNVGLFNEHLSRTEDNDFHQRVRDFGYKLLCDPTLKVYRYGRNEINALFKQITGNGYHIGRLIVSNIKGVSLRHFAPLIIIVISILMIVLNKNIFLYSFTIYCFIIYNDLIKHYNGKNILSFAIAPIFIAICYLFYGLSTFTGLISELIYKIKMA